MLTSILGAKVNTPFMFRGNYIVVWVPDAVILSLQASRSFIQPSRNFWNVAQSFSKAMRCPSFVIRRSRRIVGTGLIVAKKSRSLRDYSRNLKW